jgi:hypothetical protein
MVSDNTEPAPGQQRKEPTMKHLRRTITVVAGLALSLIGLAAAAPAAFAMRIHEPPDDTGSSTLVYPVAHAGTPGWQIALIALGAAVVAMAVVTVIVLRVRRRPTLHPATH